MKNNYYFDMDGVLANFHEHAFGWKQATRYDFIYNLRPFENNILVAKEMIAKGNKVYISSKAASEEAKQAKIDWLKKYLPEIPTYRIIIIVGKGRKVDRMKTKKGILIDDKMENIKQWEKAGFPAIYIEEKGATVQW